MSENDKKSCGVDVGSVTTKAVVALGHTILGKGVCLNSEEAEGSARKAIEEALKQAGLRWEDVGVVVATGAGRKSVDFATQTKTSETCLGAGINMLHPETRTLIDMGAESATVISLTSEGKVLDAVQHDRCASGTGIYLETMARLLNMSLDEMAQASLSGAKRAEVSNMCTVFAEQEVISLVHRIPPVPINEIAKGIFGSMVVRIACMAKRLNVEQVVAASGGVARNAGVIRELEEEMGARIVVPADPEFVAAIGAAYMGRAKQGSRSK